MSLYLRALVSTSSFSKSLRRDLKTFLDVSPVWSVISWRVNSLPSFRASITSLSVLFSFMAFPLCWFAVLWVLGFFNFAVCKHEKTDHSAQSFEFLGSPTINFVPFPCSVSNVTVPFNASVNRLTTANPNP